MLPVDNLSVDKNGDIFAAAFPRVYEWIRSSKNPFNVNPSSAVLRIRRGGKGYNGRRVSMEGKDGTWAVEKVMEDNGSVLPGATVVVHDAQTGRIFLSGIMAPYITICETRNVRV